MRPAQHSPARLFVTLLLLIFCIEGVLMLVLHLAFPIDASWWVEAMVDATLLTIFSSIFIWQLLMRPLALALRSETARAKAVMDTAAEGIITIDERGVIESFNPAAEHMVGYEASEMLGKNVSILMPAPHASAHDGYIARYLRTGEAHVIGKAREFSALRKDGTELPIELNLTEIRFEGERYFTAIIRDVAERKQAEEEIRRLAHYDGLTGLPNRRLFYDRLVQAIALAKRNRHELALLYLDLDGFKSVNDALGHDAGDELLKSVAQRIGQRLRESDTVARIGGDEFTVLLPSINSRNDTAKVAEKIISALSTSFSLSNPTQEVRIGVSIGIAIYPTDAGDMDALVKAADIAMYNAKRSKNTFHFFAATEAAPDERLGA
jgi:diguanylate cyclase (GGDEF)-like protein/PAS domain S-box-containing protein